MSRTARRYGVAACLAAFTVTCGAGVSPLASATSPSSPEHTTGASGVFAPDSPFFQRLPDDTPVAEDSEKLVASLYRQGEEFFGSRGAPNVTINTHDYTAPLYVATTRDPVHDIRPWNCQGKDPGWEVGLAKQLAGVHIPVRMQPDGSSDGNVSIYNPDTGRLVEMWQTRLAPDGVWEACWGGSIDDTSKSVGQFDVPHGASAGGMALWAYTIRQQELLDGRIEHVIGMGIPKVKQDVVSWPANRTDGRWEGTELAMGQRLRLPADLDLDALRLSPTARAVAEAAQDYGLIVTDTSGSISLAGEHAVGLREDRYDEIFRGRWSSQELNGDPQRDEDPFPLDALVALPVDYGKPTDLTSTADGTTLAGGAAGQRMLSWPTVVLVVLALVVVVLVALRDTR